MNLIWKLAIAISLVLTLVAVAGNRDRAAEGQEAHDALCFLRADLKTRAMSTEQLLKDNKGPLVFGIPRSVLVSSASGQRKTLHSLRHLDCKEAP